MDLNKYGSKVVGSRHFTSPRISEITSILVLFNILEVVFVLFLDKKNIGSYVEPLAHSSMKRAQIFLHMYECNRITIYLFVFSFYKVTYKCVWYVVRSNIFFMVLTDNVTVTRINIFFKFNYLNIIVIQCYGIQKLNLLLRLS